MAAQSNHFDQEGQAIMVDVSGKTDTNRTAIATGSIRMSTEAFRAVQQRTAQKGDVLGIARVAGIMATKQTHHLIPLCHPLMITKVSINFELLHQINSIVATCTVQTQGKTGVEMEALCGVNVALLTIYDMCKALDKSIEMHDIYLVEKQGGKSGHYKKGDL